MAIDRTQIWLLPAAAAMLLWPALYNGYPIVFADTGTYLSQAVHRYAGWDRPVFYSLFLLPLHGTVTLWPVIIVQALFAALVLQRVCSLLLPGLPAVWFLSGIALLSIGTWLPWIVSEIMPDLFTPLLILLLAALAMAPNRLSSHEKTAAVIVAAFLITTQQSSLPLAVVLGLALGWLTRRATWWLLAMPPVLAMLAVCSANLAAHGRFSISPYGGLFPLARVIYDGPGMTVLRRDCPSRAWRLCPYLDYFPANSDDFLWTQDSPLNRAGGPKLVSGDAAPIILATVTQEPVAMAAAAARDTIVQLGQFASGDGLEPWPDTVTPRIEQDFPPFEAAAYHAARQQTGSLHLPCGLERLHGMVAAAGVLACAVLLPLATRRRSACAGFLFAVLLALPVGAAITGVLSGPHDRYQARIMWLPPFIAGVSLLALRRGAHDA